MPRKRLCLSCRLSCVGTSCSQSCCYSGFRVDIKEKPAVAEVAHNPLLDVRGVLTWHVQAGGEPLAQGGKLHPHKFKYRLFIMQTKTIGTLDDGSRAACRCALLQPHFTKCQAVMRNTQGPFAYYSTSCKVPRLITNLYNECGFSQGVGTRGFPPRKDMSPTLYTLHPISRLLHRIYAQVEASHDPNAA